MKLCIFAAFAAASISSLLTSRELSPYAMFSAMLQPNNTGSCDTIPICERNHWMFRVRTLLPSTAWKERYNHEKSVIGLTFSSAAILDVQKVSIRVIY